MTARTYNSPEAFKQALEERLRSAGPGTDLSRRRQLLVFDRFLARVEAVLGNAAILKGGLALEIRLQRARTTKDVDLRMTGSADQTLERLQEAGRCDLGDFMSFEIGPDSGHPEIRNEGMQYDGFRFRAECKLGGKRYGQPFGVDVAFGDQILGNPDIVRAEDTLAFAGIEPPLLRLYPVESHIAEKLHAYTMPRPRLNSRVKDLPDLALLAMAKEMDAAVLRAALELTFNFRDTHPLPKAFPLPPREWEGIYAAMSVEDSLEWKTLGEVSDAVRRFLDPVLSGDLTAKWNPRDWSWAID